MAKKKTGKKRPAASRVPVPRGKTKGKPASGGPIRAVCRFLGSAELAMALLVISVAVLAGATFLDSARGSEIAQWYFYHSRWFIALLALLVINVLTATILRWPWKKRHSGFLATHFGLIVLLGGAMWSFLAGVEGRLTFVEGETADTIVVSDRSQLTISWREGGSPRELAFTFAPGPVDWPLEEPLDFGESDGFRVKVLRFYRHARPEVNWVDHVRHATREVTFQPVAFAPGESEAPEAAALFEIAAGGETQRTWLQRGGQQHGFQRIQTAKGPAAISYGYAQRPLGFSLKLVDFKRGRNPGGMGDASYASAVELKDESLALTRQCTISMNEPLTHGKFTFYQAGFDRTGGGRDVSRLSVAYDPGRFLKYSGCLMMCVGTFVMFYWKGRPSNKGRSATAPGHGTNHVPAD